MPSNIVEQLQEQLGSPTELQADPRAGIGAVWGSRKTGAFAVSRTPDSEWYEVSLIPQPRSDVDLRQDLSPPTTESLNFFKARLTAGQLNEWVENNIAVIDRVVKGN